MGKSTTWYQDDFGGGIDLRDGLFSKRQAASRERLNLWTDKGRKPVRRPPCLQDVTGLVGGSQGLLSVDGVKYVIVHPDNFTVPPGELAVSLLRFTPPPLTTTEWELVAAQVFNGRVEAWIRHGYPSTAYPTLLALHVWDGLLYAPTYVEDPYLPGAFSPSIADLTEQQYSSTFRPAMGQAVSKAWTSTLRGNTQSSRTADSRYWNQRTKDSILETGWHYCFICPEGQNALREFVVAVAAADLPLDGRWAYYVLERAQGTSWVPLTEVNVSPSSDWTWQATSVPSRFAGGPNELKILVRWGQAEAGLLRLRLVAGATAVEMVTSPTITTSGAGSTRNVNATTASSYRYRGGDLVNVAAASPIGSVAQGNDYLLGLGPSGWTFWNLTANGFPNGGAREAMHILKRITWATGPDPVVADYDYAYELDANSAWYTQKVIEAIDAAGSGDVDALATAAHDNTGGTVTSLVGLRNRLLVTFSGSMQLWEVDESATTTRLLDQLNFGTGDQETPSPLPWYSSALVPTQTGPRAIVAGGNNTDNLQDSNVGEPIGPLWPVEVLASAYWARYGQAVFAVRDADGAVWFHVLDYSRDSKLSAWCRWSVLDVTTVDPGSMFADGSKLYFRSGLNLLWFDADATVFMDFSDPDEANAFESVETLHFHHLDKPGRMKRFLALDLVQRGSCDLEFLLPPHGSEGLDEGPLVVGQSISGITYGRARIPLAFTAEAVSVRFRTRSVTGWQLQSYGLDFNWLNR